MAARLPSQVAPCQKIFDESPRIVPGLYLKVPKAGILNWPLSYSPNANIKSNHSARPPISQRNGVTRLLMTESAENGKCQKPKISPSLSGVSHNSGLNCNLRRASSPISKSSGWTMLKIPPINANGQRLFLNQSQIGFSFARSADTFSG